MALYLNFILELYYTPWISVIVISHFALGQSATITSHVARAVPFSDKSLTGTPVLTYTAVSKLRCIVECTRTNCSSFNFGLDTCELMLTYVCEDTETLVTRTDFKHYDVEFGIWVQDADTYRQTTPCTTLGRCSPKCFTGTTTTTTTTTTPPPTTVTTTTTSTATTTSTTTTTTTTTPAATTPPPPGPGEVTYTCIDNSDCLVTANADCRNGAVCECIAGYSYNPTTKTCDTGCTTFSTTYSQTASYELFGQHLWFNASLPDRQACEQECNRHTFCEVFVWNFIMGDCFILDLSKLDVPGAWASNAFMQYWQRNCLN